MITSRIIVLEKGVVVFLVGYGRVLTMTWEDAIVVGKCHDFFLQVGYQFLMVAAGEVGAADAATEKGIASKNGHFGGYDETEAAGAMTRDKATLNLDIADL